MAQSRMVIDTVRAAVCGVVLLAASGLSPVQTAAQAQTEADISPGMRTGWMELVKGHVDETMGAKVREVEEDAEHGARKILVAIPKEIVADRQEIEEVRVIGRAPDRMEIELPEFETEWVDDYDNDYYGLLVRVKGGPKTPFRLFLSAGAGVLDNSVQVQP